MDSPKFHELTCDTEIFIATKKIMIHIKRYTCSIYFNHGWDSIILGWMLRTACLEKIHV